MSLRQHRLAAVLAVAIFAFGIPAIAQQIVINEVQYNPLGPDTTVLLEFVELYNADSIAVDISTWELDFGPDPFAFPPSTVMNPGDFLVVAEDSARLFNATGFTTPYEFGGLLTGLDNGGERIVLWDGAVGISNVIDLVDYDDDPPWPTDRCVGGANDGLACDDDLGCPGGFCIGPDGAGESLELIHFQLDNALPSSWAVSLVTHGTPGALNSTFSNAPVVATETPPRLSAVEDLSAVGVVFSAPASGVTAGDLTVDGVAALSVTGSGAGPYVFDVVAPAPGSAQIALASGSIQAGGVPFGGDSWTVSVGLVIVINELHYHPQDPNGTAEFIELYNAGTNSADLSNWVVSDGVDYIFAPGMTMAPGDYLVLAQDSVLFDALTGYSGAIPWTAGALANGGERIALSDVDGNELDTVDYSDGGTWPKEPDGFGPSLELLHPRLPNEFGQAWRASTAPYGTPGAQNSIYDAAPAPLIFNTRHVPAIPAAFESVTVSATVVDDSVTPAVTLHYREDDDPTMAYSSVTMLDDGLSGDGAAGDGIYGATVPGLGDGARLDFTIRADDGNSTSAAPAGHDTLNAGAYPRQTFLCKFSDDDPPTDFPLYHLITTQKTRNDQAAHNKTEYDATFVRCDASGTLCDVFYNVIERYRGRGSLNQHPHSFRVDFSSDQPLPSELGFDVFRLNLLAQQPARQALGFQLFREAGLLAPVTHHVRLNTNPLSHGGIQDYVYLNAERVDDDFLESQGGNLPTRLPDRCDELGDICDSTADCPLGQICTPTDNGNLYRGRVNAALQWLGPSAEDGYRTIEYEKDTNVEADDWTDLINMCDALWCSSGDGGSLCTEDSYDGEFPSLVAAMADVDQWMRWFALHNLIVNTEGGLYRDTGDDYYIYFPPSGIDAVLFPWDMDAFFGDGSLGDESQTIWRTRVDSVERVIEHNEFAGRFVGSICDMMNTVFVQAEMDARIDALPDVLFPTGTPQGSGPQTKQAMKDWVANRRGYLESTLVTQTTIEGVPSSPYVDPNPMISLSGQLNQCWTHDVLVNGLAADSFSITNATWAHVHELVPGLNTIVVRVTDHNGIEIERVEDTVVYDPPGGGLRLIVPTRMVGDMPLSFKAEMLDQFGRIDWRHWNELGSVSVRRVSDQTPVPMTVTVFDSHTPVPEDTIRFYNGIGSVSLTIDDPASVVGEDVEVEVAVGGRSTSKVVSVLENLPGLFRPLSGVLTGPGLSWNRSDGVIHLSSDCTIPSGSTLTIEAGTLVMVDPGALDNGVLVSVAGQVSATGTTADPIVFFAATGPAAMTLSHATASNASSWQGIAHTGSGSSAYEYVFVTGAGNGAVVGHPRPPILAVADTHSISFVDGMVCDGSGMGISGNGIGSYTISRSLFSRLGIGGEFDGNGHTLIIEDSWFTGIGWSSDPLDGDLINLGGPDSNQIIRRSVFADGGDDAIDHSQSAFRIEDSLIWSMADKAVSMSGGSVDVYNSLLFENGSGITGGGALEYVTIADASPMQDPHNSENSIIWPDSFDTCDSAVNFTLVGNAGDLGCGAGNLTADPLFADPDSRDYSLRTDSPAATAGPTGGRIGWLGFPNGLVCAVDADCNDNDVCTTDTCEQGSCAFAPVAGCVPCTLPVDCDDGNFCTTDTCGGNGTCLFSADNEGQTCADGLSCTIGDVCTGGICGGTPACPLGQGCSQSTGYCEPQPTLVTFRQSVAGYGGNQDTFIEEFAAGEVRGALSSWGWDLTDGGAEGSQIGLIRFDSVFGVGPDVVPLGATIESASLTLGVFDPGAAPEGEIHPVLVDWDQSTTTWNSFGGEAGVQPDEYGGLTAAAPSASGPAIVDVSSDLQAWANGEANFGWVFLPNSTNHIQVRASEYATIAERPLLVVEFVGSGCALAADCDDANPCTLDDCIVNLCENDPIPGCCDDDSDCDDAEECTTDSCDLGTNTCASVDNSDLCDDGNACTVGDTCSGGTCNSGTTVDCDDANVCTDDSCDSVLGCVHDPNINSCDDQVACTGGDTCAAGICVGVDMCTGGQTCNMVTGLCEPRATVVFREGQNGYASTHDTFIQEDAPTSILGALDWFEWDSADGASQTPSFALIRFGNLFDTQGGIVPAGASIVSATLTYTIGGGQSPIGNGGRLHVIDPLVSWDESTVSFSSFGGDFGVQQDEYSATYEVAYGTPAGAVAIDVTDAVQGWSLDPGSNAGWVVVPMDNDGVAIRSSEFAGSLNERPTLTVVVGNVPDPAEPPTAQSVGARYVSVTPAPGATSVALRVDSVALPCMPKYVDAAGLLVDDPVFQSSQDWGTVLVGDREVTPETTYEFRSDVRHPLEPQNLSDPVQVTTWLWGDADDDGSVDLFDLVCVLDGFQDIYLRCTLQGDDLRGDVPNRTIDLFDIVAMLDAFQSIPYPDVTPCAAGATMAAAEPARDAVLVTMEPDKTTGTGGERIPVHLYAYGASGMRGYQLGVHTVSSEPGRPTRARGAKVVPRIDTSRTGFVFEGLSFVTATDEPRSRLAAALTMGGITTSGRVYLGTVDVRLPQVSDGDLFLELSEADTVILDSFEEPFQVELASATKIRIRKVNPVRSRR